MDKTPLDLFRESIIRLSTNDKAFNDFCTSLKSLKDNYEKRANSNARAGLFDNSAKDSAIMDLGSLQLLELLIRNIDISIKGDFNGSY